MCAFDTYSCQFTWLELLTRGVGVWTELYFVEAEP